MTLLRDSFVLLSVIPFVPFVLIYFIGTALKKDRRKVLFLAMDVTTLFLLLSVSALFNMTFDSRFGLFLILIFVLIFAGLIGGAQNRLKGEVDKKRLLRAVWRFSFFLMSVSFVFFTILGLIKYISQAM
ncbi:DUF3397 domain-containing protein [Paenibacillus tepidiphilus]|uniref:DUF3397 domain-containing protein n=1 Tax=Paenibacillus tepidiphilus TaxID=2608683 RepID=UPI00123A1436|nr:DUF3397 domain-containing protein [Paenibacillus tepidiphilus]